MRTVKRNEEDPPGSRNSLRLVQQQSKCADIFDGQPSDEAQRMRADLKRVARTSFNILITGETGTGKTQMARQIHRLSSRATKPFVELNCANLPEHSVEAELFGHRKGAFTGADYERKGLFEEANGGMLFLDEIGDIPLTVQNRLLRAIEEKQIKRLGTNHYKSVDVQVISATSRKLAEMVLTDDFREDLYCRLAVLRINASPLRERREDIPAMIDRFLCEASQASPSAGSTDRYRIKRDAIATLGNCNYRGNIRSLRNLVYELTTYVESFEPISLELVHTVLLKARPSESVSNLNALATSEFTDTVQASTLLRHSLEQGDVMLPLELCVLRRGETFKQWAARAKRCAIEATRESTGGTMQMVADRLGLTNCSLKGHLNRAKREQSNTLFEWR